MTVLIEDKSDHFDDSTADSETLEGDTYQKLTTAWQ